jgi:hypothetical protein
MNAKRIVSDVKEKITGPRICWMKGNDCLKASIVVCLSASTLSQPNAEQVTKLADKVERIASKEASRIGSVVSVGVVMGGKAMTDDTLSVIGIADIVWTPEVEKKLMTSGIFQLV